MEDILSVDKIEAFFVGPNDLSRSLGIWRQWNHPKFEEDIQRILDAAEETGTVPGILAPIEEAYKTIKRGFKIINIGRDVGFLKQAAAQELQKARSPPKDMDA